MKRQQGALDRSVLGAGTRERARLNRRRHHGVALPAVAISWKARPAQERGLGSHARRATVTSAIPNARRSHNLCYINGLWVLRQKLSKLGRTTHKGAAVTPPGTRSGVGLGRSTDEGFEQGRATDCGEPGGKA